MQARFLSTYGNSRLLQRTYTLPMAVEGRDIPESILQAVLHCVRPTRDINSRMVCKMRCYKSTGGAEPIV
jgi:hypothetical protein